MSKRRSSAATSSRQRFRHDLVINLWLPDLLIISLCCCRSLFRTDSEEQGIKEVPQVSGPVASYSLFDSTWSVPFKRSPITGTHLEK